MTLRRLGAALTLAASFACAPASAAGVELSERALSELDGRIEKPRYTFSAPSLAAGAPAITVTWEADWIEFRRDPANAPVIQVRLPRHQKLSTHQRVKTANGEWRDVALIYGINMADAALTLEPIGDGLRYALSGPTMVVEIAPPGDHILGVDGRYSNEDVIMEGVVGPGGSVTYHFESGKGAYYSSAKLGPGGAGGAVVQTYANSTADFVISQADWSFTGAAEDLRLSIEASLGVEHYPFFFNLTTNVLSMRAKARLTDDAFGVANALERLSHISDWSAGLEFHALDAEVTSHGRPNYGVGLEALKLALSLPARLIDEPNAAAIDLELREAQMSEAVWRAIDPGGGATRELKRLRLAASAALAPRPAE